MGGRSVPNLDDWRVQRFLEWLCTSPDDRFPQKQVELAAELTLPAQTLINWKNDPDFLAAWEHLYLKTIGSVARQQEILQRLYETAIDRTDPRQVVAAKTYLDVIGKAKPTRGDTSTKKARELTDEQLLAILSERAEREIADRG